MCHKKTNKQINLPTTSSCQKSASLQAIVSFICWLNETKRLQTHHQLHGRWKGSKGGRCLPWILKILSKKLFSSFPVGKNKFFTKNLLYQKFAFMHESGCTIGKLHKKISVKHKNGKKLRPIFPGFQTSRNFRKTSKMGTKSLQIFKKSKRLAQFSRVLFTVDWRLGEIVSCYVCLFFCV